MAGLRGVAESELGCEWSRIRAPRRSKPRPPSGQNSRRDASSATSVARGHSRASRIARFRVWQGRTKGLHTPRESDSREHYAHPARPRIPRLTLPSQTGSTSQSEASESGQSSRNGSQQIHGQGQIEWTRRGYALLLAFIVVLLIIMMVSLWRCFPPSVFHPKGLC